MAEENKSMNRKGRKNNKRTNMDNWCLIESDPAVFTKMMNDFGCTGALVKEIFTLEENDFQQQEPIHGLIFLFKWMSEHTPDGQVIKDSKEIFFARQIVTNACATQALLSILLNLRHTDIDLGEALKGFKQQCQDLDPEARGHHLGKNEKIRKVHNSFALPVHYGPRLSPASSDDDVYHYVGYIPINGRLYELDGLHEGPIDLGEIKPNQNWMDVVRPIIKARMQRYNSGEIHFNLMAVVSDPQFIYDRQMQVLFDDYQAEQA